MLVLSMQDDPRYVREAFAAGASGYVLKEAADTEVVAAIREVAGGGRYVHPELGARLVAAETAERRRAEEDPLSDREREVLRLLALGHTNQEIAKQLYISVRTAETHRAHIMQKLRLSSRAELVRYALDAGPARRVLRTDGPPEGGPRCQRRRIRSTRGRRSGARPPAACFREAENTVCGVAERAADREDREADAREQQGDPDDDPEEGELRRPCSSCSAPSSGPCR